MLSNWALNSWKVVPLLTSLANSTMSSSTGSDSLRLLVSTVSNFVEFLLAFFRQNALRDLLLNLHTCYISYFRRWCIAQLIPWRPFYISTIFPYLSRVIVIIVFCSCGRISSVIVSCKGIFQGHVIVCHVDIFKFVLVNRWICSLWLSRSVSSYSLRDSLYSTSLTNICFCVCVR